MLEFSEKLRTMLAEKLMDTANVALGAMVFGQFLNERPLSIWVGSLGAAIWAGLMMCGAILVGRRRR